MFVSPSLTLSPSTLSHSVLFLLLPLPRLSSLLSCLSFHFSPGYLSISLYIYIYTCMLILLPYFLLNVVSFQGVGRKGRTTPLALLCIAPPSIARRFFCALLNKGEHCCVIVVSKLHLWCEFVFVSTGVVTAIGYESILDIPLDKTSLLANTELPGNR